MKISYTNKLYYGKYLNKYIFQNHLNKFDVADIFQEDYKKSQAWSWNSFDAQSISIKHSVVYSNKFLSELKTTKTIISYTYAPEPAKEALLRNHIVHYGPFWFDDSSEFKLKIRKREYLPETQSLIKKNKRANYVYVSYDEFVLLKLSSNISEITQRINL